MLCRYVLLVPLVSVIVSGRTIGLDCEKDCNVDGTVMVCEHCIPQVVPEGVSNVRVIDNTMDLINEHFSDVSWQSVEYLDIAELEPRVSIIRNNTFENLNSMTYLGLHLHERFDHIDQIGGGNISGLRKVRHLNLTRCFKFSFDVLYSFLDSPYNFAQLDELTLVKFNTIFGDGVSLNSSFLDIIGRLGVKIIRLDYSPIRDFVPDPTTGMCSSVRELSVAYCHFVWKHMHTTNWGSCASLRSVNTTGSTGYLSASSIEDSLVTFNVSEWQPAGIKYFQNVIRMIWDDLFKPNQFPPMRYVLVGELNFTLDLKTIYLRQNNMPYVNLEFHIDLFKHMEFIDLSENTLEFINPTFFGNLTAINNVSLAKNKLSKMAENSPDEFDNLLAYLNNLETIDLSENGLSSIPSNMFILNTQLTRIVLRKNALSGFARTEHILPEYIDLSFNSIQIFDSGTMEWFNNVSKVRENGTFKVNLEGNPLQCSCYTINFVQWLVDSDFIDKDQPLKCYKKGTFVNITSKIIEELEQECKQEFVDNPVWLYITGSVCSVMLIVAFVPLTKLCRFTHRRYLRSKCIEAAIGRLQEQGDNETIPVFVVYCEMDHLVFDFTRKQLTAVFDELTGLFDSVGWNDHNFEPGHSIFTELERCLRISYAHIVIVSDNFINDVQCQRVLDMVLDSGQPMALLNLNNVATDRLHVSLPKRVLIGKVHDRLANDGGEEFQLSPPVRPFCTAVLESIGFNVLETMHPCWYKVISATTLLTCACLMVAILVTL